MPCRHSLPACVRPTTLQADAETGDGFVDLGMHTPMSRQEAAGNLMPNALHIPGVCHAIHNGSANLDTSFSEWADFLEKLKVLHKFLGSRGRRERFVEVVLRSSPSYAEGRKLMQEFSHTLHVARWGEVATYLEDALPIFVFVRAHWDEVAYTRGTDGNPSAEDGFEAGSLTQILADSWFYAYREMQLSLLKHIFKLLRWAEGCPCHESLL